MTVDPPADLDDLVRAVPGVSTLYAPRTLTVTAAALVPALGGRGTDRITVTDSGLTLRIGIDLTRTAAEVTHDIQHVLTQHLAGSRLAGLPITVEIATIR